jgi:3-phosphoshikimate 1-carboxyvinyltransferase
VEEPGSSRDHTERMLQALGIECRHGDGFALVEAEPGQHLQSFELRIPADPSAAALLAACALAVPGSRVELAGVCLNPRRTGFLDVLRRMGAEVATTRTGTDAGEEVGTLSIGEAPLRGTVVAAAEVPGLVDEVPALAAVAAFAEGTTVFEGVGELRVKESDRLASLVELLAAWGIDASASTDRLEVRGGTPRRRLDLPGTGDHRILMAGASLGLAARARAGEPALTLDPAGAAVSDPGFFELLQELDGAARD